MISSNSFLKIISSNKIYLANLLLLNLAWSASFFSYYMIGLYVKYIPGDIFTNIIIASISEASSCLISGFVANRIGTKSTMIYCFLIGGLFGTAIIYVPVDASLMIITCLLLTKFGVSSALNLCFLVTSEYFPVEISSTVFGWCGITSRVVSILAPLIAEWEAPIPMVIYAAFCFSSMFGIMFLRKYSNKKDIVDIDIKKEKEDGTENSYKMILSPSKSNQHLE